MIRRRLTNIACLLMVTLFGLALYAQSDRATITGLIKDPSGAVVPGVSVTVKNAGTNDVQTVISNESGFYSVRNLPIGNYSVTFNKSGFKAYERKGLTLGISQIANIDIALQVGTQTETVEVTSEVSMVQTETAALTTNLNNQSVNDLPLSVAGGRALSTFMFAYVPGVEGTDYDSHINGSMAKSKEVMIDGTSAVAQLGGYISESQPSMESVQEFQVETAGIRADEGRSGGGVFRYEMKSGTNAFHGSLVGYLQTNSLNANSASNKLALKTDPNPDNAQFYKRSANALNDWGGSVGGPIVKDKLFFFTAYERYMFHSFGPGPTTSSVPTADFLAGDFGKILDKSTSFGPDPCGATIYKGAIFNPASGCVFANNLITSPISAVSQKIVGIYKQYYAPQNDLPQNNAMPAANIPWNHQNQFSTKVDYNISSKHHLNGSFIYNYYPRLLADQGGIWSLTAAKGGPLANAYEHDTKSPAVRLNDSYAITPSILNSLRFTMNRFYNPSIDAAQGGKWDSALGLLKDGSGNMPKLNFSTANYTPWNPTSVGSTFNDFYAANTFIINDDVSWVLGRHTMKFGGEFRAMQFNSHPDANTLQVNFDSAQTGAPNESYATSVGHSFASFLLGEANSGSVNRPINIYGRRKALSVYASDDLKVTSRLTLNLDLRWDYNKPYKELNGHWSMFDPKLTNPVTGVKGALSFLNNGSQSFETKQAWLNFAPHVGAAYKLDDKTVIRGSFSVFYVPLNMNTWGAVPYSFNPGYGFDDQVRTTGQRAAAFNWDGGYPGTAVAIGKDPSFTKWGMVTIDPKALTPGNTQQFTVGIQREISKDFKADVSYIQSHSYHLQSGVLNGNQPTDLAAYKALLNRGTQWNWVASAGDAAAAGVPYPYAGFAGSAWMALAKFPAVAASWGPLFYVGNPQGNSDYKALQISLTKRASHGLTFQGSYVYSATHGDVDTSFQELWGTGTIQNIYDLKHERDTISSFDMTHIVKGFVSYELPFGRGKMLLGNAGPILNGIVNGWKLNGNFHYNTGTPMAVRSSNSYPGFNSVYANIAPGCSFTSGDRGIGKQYLNTACFSNPANGELGNGKNFLSQVRKAGTATEDIGIDKSLAFGNEGRYRFTFKAEFFNVFNRSRYDDPVSNMSDGNFGKIVNYSKDLGPRIGQLGARITF
ncbi:MAG TPA: TonB-dependent receptor [Candidatus Saccharimonadales bacterium]|nr:TonB-dependent receptor [Candidatus Saccharimonadales bacterium]